MVKFHASVPKIWPNPQIIKGCKMNPKEIAEELIIKMINAADRKQTRRVRECFADVVFVDHSSLNGMRGALVSADEFVTS